MPPMAASDSSALSSVGLALYCSAMESMDEASKAGSLMEPSAERSRPLEGARQARPASCQAAAPPCGGGHGPGGGA